MVSLSDTVKQYEVSVFCGLFHISQNIFSYFRCPDFQLPFLRHPTKPFSISELFQIRQLQFLKLWTNIDKMGAQIIRFASVIYPCSLKHGLSYLEKQWCFTRHFFCLFCSYPWRPWCSGQACPRRSPHPWRCRPWRAPCSRRLARWRRPKRRSSGTHRSTWKSPCRGRWGNRCCPKLNIGGSTRHWVRQYCTDPIFRTLLVLSK